MCDIKLVGDEEKASILLQEMNRANRGRIKVNNTMIEEGMEMRTIYIAPQLPDYSRLI